jgi:1-acyl-sn-glycerol-3-phosphate acyltransferase
MTVRGLGEHAHYAIPLWRDLLAACGTVRGTRDNVRALMRERQNVLVFPGGAREVNKRRGEQYQLIWKERIGFARLAIEHRYPVVPFAAVGAEEMLDVVVDVNNPVMAAFKGALERLGRLPLEPSIVRGVGLTPLPRPKRLYFWFGEPTETTAYARRRDSERAARALRDEVKTAVQNGIAFSMTSATKTPTAGSFRACDSESTNNPAVLRAPASTWSGPAPRLGPRYGSNTTVTKRHHQAQRCRPRRRPAAPHRAAPPRPSPASMVAQASWSQR